MTCEKCWTDSGGDAMAYAVLVRERTESGESCTPQEQCGERHTKGGDALCACQRAKQKAERAVIDAAKAWAYSDGSEFGLDECEKLLSAVNALRTLEAK